MATLFSDNFESGTYASWTTAVTGVGTTITADATSAFAGSFGSHHVKPTSANNGDSNALNNFTPSATGKTSMQFRFKIFSATVDAGGELTYGQLRTESPLFNWVLCIRNSLGNNQFAVRMRDGTISSVGITLSGYNLIEMVRDTSGANPVNRCYIDGTLAATITDSTAGTIYTPGQVRIALAETSWNATGEVYYDDVLVSDVQQVPLPIPPYTMRMNTRTRPKMFVPGNAR